MCYDVMELLDGVFGLVLATLAALGQSEQFTAEDTPVENRLRLDGEAVACIVGRRGGTKLCVRHEGQDSMRVSVLMSGDVSTTTIWSS